MEHPTRTDTKVENTDRPDPPDKPPAPPRDTPGAPGYPSRRESLARAREAAPQEGGTSQVAVKDSGSRGPEEHDDKLSSPQADSGKEKEEPSGPEAPDGEEDTAKPDVEAGGSESGEESERGEGGEEGHSESEKAGQTDAEPSGGESQDDRDGKLADAQTKSVGEKPETPDEPVSPKQQHTLPADNPGSPHQPSRRESLARAREHVQPESGSQRTETTDTSGLPPAEPAVEPVPSPPENGSFETERPQEQAPSPQQDQKSGSDEPPPPSELDGEGERDMAEGVAQEPEGQPGDLPGDDLSAGPTGEPDGTASLDGSTDVADDLGRRISGEEPADDNGRRAEFYDDVLERGIPDQLRRLAAKLNRSDGPRELEGLVDRPDFQDPEQDPRYTPDRYGTPLDRDDGTRTPLFKGTPKREQAEQGGLGDCGIVATLGAVAGHRPEAIRACVSETGDGNYQVRLHEAKYSAARQRYEPTGASITLTLTPDLPVLDAAPGMPAFAPIMENTAWAPVLEKAVAGWDQTWSAERWGKVKRLREAQGNSGESPKGYVRLNRGSSPGERAELLTQLTGLPAKTVQFPSGYDKRGRSADRQLRDEIAQQLSDGKPVLVGTRDKRKGESKLPKGLRANHAYEVTKIDDQGKFHLRNPWGEKHPEAMTVQEFKREARPRYTTLE
ncbi:C2 family cysteine protease [Actinomadura sp. NPDC048955]|uniref:C2 family cysteine protease n=1 Tax=Actinomadura sp. NPDC048955 TaxID=3158228 RepID=UPI00340D9957